MTIRFNQRWHGQREGDIREWRDGAANVLIRRGIATEHIPPKRKRARHADHAHR